ncbi:MMPL family transporter [Aldersonia sp. NBC_00410]|uniref:MMPL family transporter n=1 Tax=Aldersonia sp. NBC_00410 TaxID=2975954 RepID=UPI0022525EC7|nr:MMPL family transporter [Aldersonia sp. NBC_00410]MCX5045031.1 MMPL family transporter [Aldersonia sp. NBC_00410]
MDRAATDVDSTSRDSSQPPRPRRGWPVFTALAVAIVVFFLGGFGGSFQAKLSEVSKNDNAAFLPGSAESTKASTEADKFLTIRNVPGFVVFNRDSGLTEADRADIAAAQEAVMAVPGVDASGVLRPQFSADNTTASLLVPLIGKQSGVETTGDELSATETAVLDAATQAVSQDNGLGVYPAGPAGLLAAFIEVFSAIDGPLLLAALGVVILILLVVYRSPVLWIFPLLSAVLALGIASMVIYYLAKHDVITLNGQSQGILSVLVIGAGTDYALLLVARYREELHEFDNRFDAMIAAWKGCAAAIFASGLTVMVGLLCLTFSELNSNKGLGPVAAIGIACTVLVMMTFLPVALAAVGRWVFWPRIPRTDHVADLATHGYWGRIANTVVNRRRPAWIGATVVLFIGALGISMLDTSGLTSMESFTNEPEAIVGQQLYDANFDRGAGAPAVIVTNAAAVDDVVRVAEGDPGVSNSAGSVCIQPDIAKLADLAKQFGGAPPEGSAPGCLPPQLQVQPIDGRTIVNAILVDPYDSPEATETIERLRTELHALPNADVLVGGSTAETVDVQSAAIHDRNLIIPIVLAVIFLVLALLLRALIAPILLIASVVLSFAAALGVSAFVFEHIFGFAGSDQSFPLFVFVFLVALGIDYNIFLMTRVREETFGFGTRDGIRRGLAVTGGVITSAGCVLAATFAVLGTLPLVFLAEVGFAVAFGVLLDTLLVRSVLVPALSADIGKFIWWPSKLASGRD